MKTISLGEIIKRTTDISSYEIIVAKLESSFLVGPKITKSLCINCVKKRFESSVYYHDLKIRKLSKKNRNMLLELLKIHPILENEILEFNSKGRLITSHYILPVPSCMHEKA
jgi:hypothetical protein